MKKQFSFCIMLLMIALLTSASAMADEYNYYGDYAYVLENGQAHIAESNGAACGPGWDDDEYGIPDRPGQSDKAATYKNHFDGVWQTVLPNQLGGYPVVSIDPYGIADSNIHDIIIPEGITSIGEGAFSYCEYTTAITIPESVTYIGEDAFEQCPATLRVTEGSYAAKYAQTNNLRYTYDAEYKVFQSGLWLYYLENDTATLYGYDAIDTYGKFWEDTSEQYTPERIDIVIPDQLDGHPVTTLSFQSDFFTFSSDYVWNEDDIIFNSVTIPDSLTKITGNPFTGVFASGIQVSPIHTVYASVDGVLFDKQNNILLAYADIHTKRYAVPDGTTAIASSAFAGCESLTAVTIPSSVTTIGEFAFSGCTNVSSIILSKGLTSIGEGAFSECSQLTDIAVPESITSIPDDAFGYCRELSSVTIPASVKSIGDSAFRFTSLKKLAIPDSVVNISGTAFYGSSLAGFDVSPSHPVYKVVDDVLFNRQQHELLIYPAAKTGEYTVPEGTIRIGAQAFANCEGLTAVTIPFTVTSLGESAFQWCENLTSVTLPNRITRIPDNAFWGCRSLTNVKIPEGVSSIGNQAFYGCDSLTSMNLPSSVTTIDENAFYRCFNLTSITVPASVTSIGKDAFYGCGDRDDFYYLLTFAGSPEQRNERLTLLVEEGSFAEQYAKDMEIRYTYTIGT